MLATLQLLHSLHVVSKKLQFSGTQSKNNQSFARCCYSILLLGLFLKFLIPSSRSSSGTMVPMIHTKHTTWCTFIYYWVLPYSLSSLFVAPQGIIPWNDVFSPLQCTSAIKKGRVSNHPARQGEMDNTQSWLFQCQMITNTTTNCLIRHLISEARKNRQHKPKNYRMWFFSTVNRCAVSRTKVHWPVQ